MAQFPKVARATRLFVSTSTQVRQSGQPAAAQRSAAQVRLAQGHRPAGWPALSAGPDDNCRHEKTHAPE